MKKYLFATFDKDKYKILHDTNVVWWSRPRVLVKHLQNHHTYILKSYSKNTRELWVELFASLLWKKINGIDVQKASITIIPEEILEELKKQLPENFTLKPLVVLIQNAFPKWFETKYWFQILWLSPTDSTSLEVVYEKITTKYKWYWRDEKILQSYFDMLIFDAIIWNMDRHLENWGVHESKQIFLEKKKENIHQTVEFTTLFDHWSAWLYELSDEKIIYYLENPKRYETEYIEGRSYSLLINNQWLSENIFCLLSNAYQDKRWRKFIKASINKVLEIHHIDFAEIIFKIPEDKWDYWKRETIEYNKNRKELLLRWCIIRQNKLKDIIS